MWNLTSLKLFHRSTDTLSKKSNKKIPREELFNEITRLKEEIFGKKTTKQL